MIAVEQTRQQEKYDNYVYTTYPYCNMVCVKGCNVLQYEIKTV